MNATGCTVPGMATDQVFRQNAPLACDVPVALFCVVGTIICVLNIIRAVGSYKKWRTRHAGTTQQPKTNRRRKVKVPWGCVSISMFVVIEIVFVILAALNVITFSNGWSVAVYTVGYLCFAWNFTYGLFRLVSLGEKILPKEQRGTSSGKRLSTFDLLGKTMVFFQLFAVVSSSIVLIVLGPIFPEYEKELVQAGFAFKSMYCALSGAGYVYHFQRCITIIKAVQSNLQGIRSTASSSNGLNTAIWRMRWNQGFHIAIVAPVAIIYILLAADAIPAIIWIVVAPPVAEGIVQAVINFYVLRRGKQENQQYQNRKSQVEDQGIVAQSNGVASLTKAEAIVPRPDVNSTPASQSNSGDGIIKVDSVVPQADVNSIPASQSNTGDGVPL